MKVLLKLVTCVGLGILMSSCSINEADTDNSVPTVELKLAEMHMQGYPTVDACIHFADEVNKKTEGRVNITVYSNGKLGTENETIDKTISGSVDIARVNSNPLSSYSPVLTPLIMPYVIDSPQHMEAVMDSETADNMLNNLGNGLVGLNWFYSGSRCFYSVEPIHTPQDIENKYIRVQDSAVMKDMIFALGGKPLVMDWKSMYDEFESGNLFAGENDVSSYMNFAHNIAAPYYTYDYHVYSPSVVIMNENSFNKLSDKDKEILMECAKESQQYELDLWMKYEEQSKSSLLEDGVTFIELTAEEKQQFKDACKPLYDKYASDYMSILEQIINMKY